MNPSYQQIAELFGLSTPSEETTDIEAVDEKGYTAYERGLARMQSGEFEKAIDAFRKAVDESGGTDPETLFSLASALEAADLFPQALHQYRKALKARKEDAESHIGMSEIYKRHGRGEKSIQELMQAIEEEPNQAYLRYRLAETLNDLGRPKAAYAALQEAIVLKPDEPHYHAWGADLLIRLKRFDEAVESLRAAVELSPGDDHLYVRTAIAFWGADRRQDALKACLLASELNPDHLALYGLLEAFYLRLGMTDEVRALSAKVSKLDDYDRDLVRRMLEDAGEQAV